MERIGEKVRVAVIFAPGSRVRPVWFEWNREKHTIKETTYCWRDKIGNATLLRFAVTDGSSLFELSYNTGDQNWTLVGVEAAP